MAKKTTTRTKAAQAKAAPAKASTIAVTLRGSAEWKAWLEALARHTRLDVAKVIDRALIDLAKKEGFTEEAPAR
ncbi:MAG: hypothetical protein ACXWN0_10580 [Isosphaeraceae bacterium]